MLVSKSDLRTRQSRTSVLVSLAIAGVACQQAAYGDKPELVVVTNPVTVANSSPIPAKVTNAAAIAEEGDPAKRAFGNAFSFGIAAGSSVFSVPLAQVPVGKRFVLELVSLWCAASGGSFVSSAVLSVGQNIPSGANPFTTQGFYIALQSQGTDQAGTQYFVGNLTARVYADDYIGSPYDVLLNVTQSNTAGTTNCAVSFSGYLVTL